MLESTDELKTDLAGIMTRQPKLSGMDRNTVAIEATLKPLEEEANKIRNGPLDGAQIVRDRTSKPPKDWEELNSTLHEMEAKLKEAGDPHHFLEDRDPFRAWPAKTEACIANEDSPSGLAEAEKLLSQHQQTARRSTHTQTTTRP